MPAGLSFRKNQKQKGDYEKKEWAQLQRCCIRV